MATHWQCFLAQHREATQVSELWGGSASKKSGYGLNYEREENCCKQLTTEGSRAILQGTLAARRPWGPALHWSSVGKVSLLGGGRSVLVCSVLPRTRKAPSTTEDILLYSKPTTEVLFPSKLVTRMPRILSDKICGHNSPVKLTHTIILGPVWL